MPANPVPPPPSPLPPPPCTQTCDSIPSHTSACSACVVDGVLCLPDDALLLGGRPCRAGLVCRKSGQAPAYGFVKFDNFFWDILTSFTCITTEGWHAGRRLEPARNLSTDPRPCA